ncbi:MAG: aspartate-semialdehyde dehydrogenase [Legionellales bacterium]|nr:aspartate-semialdehyde dehydrogenase [Legionellales bacterium]
MKQAVDVAVVGATGAVGEVMLDILAERNFPVNQLYALASARSAGSTVRFGGKSIRVEDTENFDFSKVKIALFSAGGKVSEKYIPKASQLGCVCIDNTSQFRYDADVPLIIPEVNAPKIGEFSKRNIIANPNCSTLQLLTVLKPLHDKAQITRINVATYQAVSGAGRQAIQELAHQTVELLNGRSIKPEFFPTQIAFNLIPHIDEFQENGYTREEMKMIWETRKILGDDSIQVNPTCVRVPVFYGHSEAVNIETQHKLTVPEVKRLLKQAPGVKVVDDPQKLQYPTPVKHASGQDPVYVGRIREDLSHPLGLNLWIVADNIRKGAALNAVQIAEILFRDYLQS